MWWIVDSVRRMVGGMWEEKVISKGVRLISSCLTALAAVTSEHCFFNRMTSDRNCDSSMVAFSSAMALVVVIWTHHGNR